MRNKLLALLVVLAMVPVYLTARSMFSSFAQVRVADSDQKIIEKMKFRSSRVEEPVEIVEIIANGQKVKVDESFVDKGDWLNGLKIRFKNVSKKTITHVDWGLRFPQTKTDTPPMGYSLIYGLYFPKQAREAPGMKYLAPGESDEVTLQPDSYKKMKEFVAQKNDLNELNTVILTLVVVYFDDGVRWSAGSQFRPDPSRPAKYVLDQ